MIRDPSDGSVKEKLIGVAALQAKYGPNWGLTSLDEKPKEKTFKAPTADELREHYAKHGLGFMPKESQD